MEDNLIEMLQSTNRVDVIDAISMLGELRSQKAVPFLLQLLRQSDNDDIKRAVVIALGDIRHPTTVADLCRYLYEEDKGILIRRACISISKINTDEAKNCLRNAINSPHPEARAGVAYALGQIGEETDLRLLEQLLDDTHDVPWGKVSNIAKTSIKLIQERVNAKNN